MSDFHSTRSRNRPSRVGLSILAVLTGVLLLIGAARAADTKPPAGGEDSASALAKQTQNPVANLVSVPFQNNLSFGAGSKDNQDNLVWVLNVQPVIPFHLNQDWLLVTRTIIPFISQEAVAAGERDLTGLGDINQSFFFSPAQLVGGWTMGAGPVFQYPTATRSELGTGKWGAGPTFAMLQQNEHWTFGVLANQIWSFAGDRHREVVNTALVDPFISYTGSNNFTVELDGGSTYDWKQRQWAVPLTAGVSQLVTIGKQSVSFGLDERWYAQHAPGAPAWGIVFTVTFLFPK